MLITTIIPTLCESARQESLFRAIESIHGASTQEVHILVVVNGQRFDPQLLEALRARNDLHVIQFSEGSLIKAQLEGRKRVTTKYFSFLDDDDEYLPNALDIRIKPLENNPTIDFVITNGYVCINGHDQILYSKLRHAEQDPLTALFNENWLSSCNHLFRSTSITDEYFEDAHAYMEWTWLAFRFGLAGKIFAAIDTPTFRINDTPGSLSKSSKFLDSRVELYRRMLTFKPGIDVTEIIRRRMCAAYHDISAHHLVNGNRKEALRAHFLSLCSHWSGLKYLTYTRHIFL
jgi:glycosyltransferase involved in cell wall biosynthesis